jgi:CheY-like chemotaxis protein
VTHILLIEDNPIDARLMHRMFVALPDWPTQITWVDDGEKALWYLRSLEEGGVQQSPGAVLLDLNLPKHDGIQVLAAFRNSQTAWDLPIFLFSSAPAEEIAALVLSNGLRADGCFEKSMDVQGYLHIATSIRDYCRSSSRSCASLSQPAELGNTPHRRVLS